MDHTTETEASDFVKFWNQILVPKFNKYRHVLQGGLSRHSEAIFPSLEVHAGERILDAGCGWGDTACMLAERVGPTGSVVGMDCCGSFLAAAREEAANKSLTNITFQAADIEIYPFEGDFDMVFSRFGTMFFSNPVAAMKNMRRALKPGGRFTFIVWRARAVNHWGTVPKEVVLRHLPEPGDDAQTCGPGPFSQADQEMVTGQLKAAGFTDIAFERVDAPFRTGNDVEDAIGFQLSVGPAGEIYREAGDLATQRHDAIMADLTAAYGSYVEADGVYMPSSSWVITGRNPA